MIMSLNFKFDLISFLIGLVAGLLVWFLFTILKKILPHLRQLLATRAKQVQEVIIGGAARYVRFAVLKKAQKYHLASALFALDEVIIPPRLLAPVSADNVFSGMPGETYIPKIMPFLPSWPELLSQYNWPSLTPEEILQNGANIAIIGQPGSGKSVTLAYLAVKLARKDLSLLDLADCVPLLAHVYELGVPEQAHGIFENAVSLYTRNAPIYLKSRIAGYLTSQARTGNLVFLLDGLDQLNAAALSNVVRAIAADLKSFPKLRIVVAASPDYLDGLLNLYFQPLSLASWNLNERLQFANQWGQNWEKWIVPQINKQIPDFTTSQLLIENWISFEGPQLNPLDWTLKLWSLYCGDASGTTTLHSLDSYVRRTTNQFMPVDALSALAVNCLRSETTTITQAQAEAILASFNVAAEIPQTASGLDQAPAAQSDPINATSAKKPDKKASISSRVIPQLAANGILTPIGENQFSFSHPILLAYLASLGFNEDPALIDIDQHNPTDDWLLHFLAAQNKADSAIQQIIDQSEAPFYSGMFAASRWLKDSPLSSEWRIFLMRRMMKLLMQPELSVELRPAIISAMVASNDPAVITLFRQMMASADDRLRILAALACGALQDTKSLHEIAILLEDSDTNVRLAACLALGIIRSPASKTYITNTFMEGDESLKQVAAEALTFLGEEGYSLLREGYGTDSLILRRAVVFGLANVRQEWSRQMLEQIAVQDGQWVVRNAAAQALETFNKPNPYIPSNLPVPSQAPWLIAYASREGVGVPPDKVPIEMLYSVLTDGTAEEKIAALDYLRLIPNDEVIHKVYLLAASEHGAIKDAALMALWYLIASGVRLSVSVY